MKEPSGSDEQSSSGSSGGSPSTVPYNQRTAFVLGNLGRDLSQAECEDRARQVFRETGVTLPKNLYAPFALSSQVVCEFDSHEQGLALKVAVAAAIPAWYDASPGNHPAVTLCLMSKGVYAGRDIVAQTLKGRLLWTAKSEEFYHENLRNNCLTIAASIAS